MLQEKLEIILFQYQYLKISIMTPLVGTEPGQNGLVYIILFSRQLFTLKCWKYQNVCRKSPHLSARKK